jgi:hypothetical protein
MDNHAEIIKSCGDLAVACDEKIEKLQNALGWVEWVEWIKWIGLVSSKKSEFNKLSIQNGIELFKVEKLIYKAVVEKKSSKYLEKLMEKYDELLGTAIEIGRDLVLYEVVVEGKYLDFCKNYLKEREELKMTCDYGIDIAKEEEDDDK